MKRICELQWDASIDEYHECRLWADHSEPHKCTCGGTLPVGQEPDQ